MEKHKTLPPGTLVRDEALEPDAMWEETNNKHVREHGYLYLVTYYIPQDNIYRCKSIATGKEGIAWEAGEIKAANTVRKESDR